MIPWYSRRTYGDVLDNGLALLHNRPCSGRARLRAEGGQWDRLDPDLKTLAQPGQRRRDRVQLVHGLRLLRRAPKGLESSKLERGAALARVRRVHARWSAQVLEYAEAMTATPPEVTDEMAEALRDGSGQRRVRRADRDDRRGERALALQLRARADQPGLQGPL